MTVRFLKDNESSEISRNKVGKMHSKPLIGTVQSVRALCREVARLGLALGIAWLCEYHPLFPHSTKYWQKDLYYFLCLLLLLYSLCNRKQLKSPADVLNREQTEEWKGWMQFMFLLYHYYKADEVYNSIRVMITCYVWMTGFGNFSFFYMKRDFGLVRVLQMLWRLNFLVAMLCLVMGNTYILYYICPLHTFFFGLVYFTMRFYPHLNHTKWGIRLKLAAVACVIFLVWDVPKHCLFKVFFTPLLGRSPIIGATGGSLWEWYFRTSLDHWATFLGMVFALNYPLMQAWFSQVDGTVHAVGESSRIDTGDRKYPRCMRHVVNCQQSNFYCSNALRSLSARIVKGMTAVAIGLVGFWWSITFFPLVKPDYNVTNPYFAFFPLLVYIFFRNLTPALRSVYLVPLHNIGKTTLETYLLQHHVWLTSNAKTLVTIVPGGYPLINALVVTVLFVALSQELYRITMSLRGMLLPDDTRVCVRNFITIAGTVSLFVAVGSALSRNSVGGSPYALAITTIISTGITLSIIQLNIEGVAPPVLDTRTEVRSHSSISTSPPCHAPSSSSSASYSASDTLSSIDLSSVLDETKGKESASVKNTGHKDETTIVSSLSSGDLKGIPSQRSYAIAAVRPAYGRLLFLGAILVFIFRWLVIYTETHSSASRILQPILLSRPYSELDSHQISSDVSAVPAGATRSVPKTPIPLPWRCMVLANSGSWKPRQNYLNTESTAASETREWVWDKGSTEDISCGIGHIKPEGARKLLSGGARILVAGDSVGTHSVSFLSLVYSYSAMRWQISR